MKVSSFMLYIFCHSKKKNIFGGLILGRKNMNPGGRKVKEAMVNSHYRIIK